MVMRSPRPRRSGDGLAGGVWAAAIAISAGRRTSDNTEGLIIARSRERPSRAQMPGDERRDLAGHGDGEIVITAGQDMQLRLGDALLKVLADGHRTDRICIT